MFLQLYIDLQIMQKYKKLELIGEGSFGSVYTIQNERNEIFALKTIQVDPFAVDQSQREIQMMKIFSHQSLVKIYDYSLTQDNELHIVMEYCENGDLQKYFQSKDKKLPPQEILSIFRQIVKAFVLMSVKGVIHRDIKPQNIMMIKNSIIKIADFGCARCIGEMEMSKIDNFSMDKGTFLYASPQQLKNQPYSFKCDVWAAGCIAYLLNFGVHPFLDSKPHFTLQKIKALTQGKVIQTHNCDLSIAQFIKLSLIYSDQERASWRQLWLCRIFAPKIKAIKEYLTYLKNLSAIASWITKQFWKVRKQFNISKNSDEIFIYFLIKFQMTNLKLALKILKKSQQYEYLFDEKSFNDYQPNEEQFNQIKKAYIEHEKYYTTVKKTMQSKDSFKQIEQREIVRTSSFADLSQSIRAGYKILKEVIPKLQSPEKKDKVWQIMAAWVNFEGYFSYEKNPNPDKFSESGYINIGEQLTKYQQGIVQ